MRKTISVVAVVSVLIGVGVGTLLPSSEHSVRPVSASAATSASDGMATLPVVCRSALSVGNEALGGALSGLGQAQSALAAALAAPTPSPSAAMGVVGQSSARVQGLLQQYNQAADACRAATSGAATSAQVKP